MNDVFRAQFPDRVGFSKKIGLDLARHPVELLMGEHQRMMQAVNRTDSAVPRAPHMPVLDIVVPPARGAGEGAK